jgi:hypothetical protein
MNMADNTQIDVNTTAGDIIATDDIDGVKHQRVKIEFGEDGNAADVSFANPMPTTNLPERSILLMILTELKIMNHHLQEITGEETTAQDL